MLAYERYLALVVVHLYSSQVSFTARKAVVERTRIQLEWLVHLRHVDLRHTSHLTLLLLLLLSWMSQWEAELRPYLELLSFWRCLLVCLFVLVWTLRFFCQSLDVRWVVLVHQSEVPFWVILALLGLVWAPCTVDLACAVHVDTRVVEWLCILFIKLFLSESEQLNHRIR